MTRFIRTAEEKLREPLSVRFHDWLSRLALRATRRVGGEEPVFYASGYMLGVHGVMIGEEFTDPITYRRFLCTRIEWDSTDSVRVAQVFGREVRA